MPNHITNRLTITGPDADKARAFIRGGDGESAICLNNIVPMPPSLGGQWSMAELAVAKHEAGVAGRYDLLHPRDRRGADHINDDHLDQIVSNIQRTGYAYWHDWRAANWGTKWDAYKVREDGETIVFDTAWACPAKALESLAARFPACGFVCEYADEDIGHNCGTLTYSGGNLVKETKPAAHKAVAFAYRVKGYTAEQIAEMEAECDA